MTSTTVTVPSLWRNFRVRSLDQSRVGSDMVLRIRHLRRESQLTPANSEARAWAAARVLAIAANAASASSARVLVSRVSVGSEATMPYTFYLAVVSQEPDSRPQSRPFAM